ncbi:hypothetical protein [Microbacterium sp. BK668]|uniref:hypothetical protein n=1 Tax=Microbacterium sp. BK668 TaxID=2512118 RepID=UPI00105D9C0E|nr:hypothetical protein [Microbacterium sp. BK668]
MGDGTDSTGQIAPDDRGRRGASGVSAFIARVLEQLSADSWLPAVFLVGNVAVLFELEPSGWHPGVWAAVSRLVQMEWGALVILLFAIVIATIAIQAFEFELLRLLEGYWRRPPLLVRWGHYRIRRHREQYESIVAEIAQTERKWTLAQLETALLAGDSEEARLWGMELKILADLELSDEEAALTDKLDELRERSLKDAETEHRLVILDLRLEDYPEPGRILPTRLGNVMRSAEDQVHVEEGENLEGFMIRHLDSLPITIADEHRVHRERLDMYCAMMLVLLALSATAVLVLPFDEASIGWHIGIPIAYLLAIWPCYNAAIASARGFGGALLEAYNALRMAGKPAPMAADISGTPASADHYSNV